MAIFKFIPQSQAWKDKRTNYVTATEVASLLGLNPSKSANKVLEEKRFPPCVHDNIWMRAGRGMEPASIIWLNEIGIPAVPADYHKVVFVTDEKHRLAASMDAKAIIDGQFFIVEIKSTTAKKYVEWENNPPINYLLQVQAQMSVSKCPNALLSCVATQMPFPMTVWQVAENKRVQEIIKQECLRFWKHAEEGIPFKFDKDVREEVLSEIYKGNEIIFLDNRVFV